MLVGLTMLIGVPCFADQEVFSVQQGMYQTFVLNDKVGLRDINGNELIPAMFTGISPVWNGFCIVQDGNNYGVWSADGRAVLPAEYSGVSLGKYAWVLGDYDQYMLYDPAADEIVSDAYEILYCGDDIPYYTIVDDDQVGLIDRYGNLILPCEYDEIYCTADCIARCVTEEYGTVYYSIRQESFLDGCFVWGTDFSSGRAIVYDEEHGACVINEEGNQVSPYFEDVAFTTFKLGITFAAQTDGEWFIRSLRQPEEIISGPYENEPEHIGKDTYTIRERDGLTVISSAWDSELYIDGISGAVEMDDDNDNTMIFSSGSNDDEYDTKYGYLFDDKHVIPPSYDDGDYFLGDYAFARRDGIWYAVDRQGAEEIRQEYLNVMIDPDFDCYVAEQDGRCYYLNRELAPITIFEPEYWAGYFEEVDTIENPIPNDSGYGTAADFPEVHPEGAAASEAKLAPFRTVGSYVVFGSYEQDNDTGNGKEPIEWLVLDYDAANHRVLLLSRFGLDVKPYNTKYVDITWKKCTLRAWLNGEFINNAFFTDEQGAILTTAVDNSKSQGSGRFEYTNGGNNTQDKIFLLSYAEANKYLGIRWNDNDNMKSRISPTAYAVQAGAWTTDSTKTADDVAAGLWWLRSPGEFQDEAALVYFTGSLGCNGVINDAVCVRPALWINLESDVFQ